MAEATDISFKICNVKVNCRAVAIIISEGNILFQKRENDSVWALPGGKIAILEKGKDTIKRELKEEIGELVEVSKLYDVLENFFEYNGERFHEYMFLYFVNFINDSKIKNIKFFDGVEEKKHLKFAWFNEKELDKYNIVPTEMKAKLKEIIEINSQDMVKSKMRRKIYEGKRY